MTECVCDERRTALLRCQSLQLFFTARFTRGQEAQRKNGESARINGFANENGCHDLKGNETKRLRMDLVCLENDCLLKRAMGE